MLAFVDLQEQLSDEHFTVDGTLTEAASLNSFRPRDADEATGTAERDGFQCSRMRRANTDPIPGRSRHHGYALSQRLRMRV